MYHLFFISIIKQCFLFGRGALFSFSLPARSDKEIVQLTSPPVWRKKRKVGKVNKNNNNNIMVAMPQLTPRSLRSKLAPDRGKRKKGEEKNENKTLSVFCLFVREVSRNHFSLLKDEEGWRAAAGEEEKEVLIWLWLGISAVASACPELAS